MLTTSSPVSSSAEIRDSMDRREERVPTYLRVERREEKHEWHVQCFQSAWTVWSLN